MRTRLCIILIIGYGLLLSLGIKSSFAQVADPIAPKLRVEGEIEIGTGHSLRMAPVTGSKPASAVKGDLYFNTGKLYTCNQDTCNAGAGWLEIANEGSIFYDDSTALLYFRSNDFTWKPLGSAGGEKRVATKIVAAYNSIDSKAGGNPCVAADGSGCSNPKADYTCDGVKDQEQINQAIRELPAAGGAVYLLEGTYNISDATFFSMSTKGIVFDKENISLIGTGAGTVLRVADNTPTFTVIAVQSNANCSLLENFKMDGNKANQSDYQDAISFASSNSQVNNLWIENFKTAAALISLGGDYNIISENHFENNESGTETPGIVSPKGSNNIYADNIIVNNTTRGFVLEEGPSCLNSIFLNNIVKDNSMQGFFLKGNLGGKVENNIFAGNIISNNTLGIYLLQGTGAGSSVANNIIAENVLKTNGGGISAAGNYFLIKDNVITNSTDQGISFSDTAKSIISGNMLLDNGQDGIQISASAAGTSDTNLLASNRIIKTGPTTYFGINIGSNSTNHYLVGNYIQYSDATGWVNKRINDLGTNTKYTDKEKLTLEQNKRPAITGATLDYSSFSYVLMEGDCPLTFVMGLAGGKSTGDILILEASTNAIKFPPLTDRAQLPYDYISSYNGSHTELYLDDDDMIEFIWNGDYWLTVSYVDYPY